MEAAVTSFQPYLGPAAGILTSVLWSATALCFAAAGRRIGPTLVNGVRICLAVVWLGLTHRALTGVWVPVAHEWQVLYLALSGVVGLTLGDWALFTAFVRIGPRLAMLVMTTAPIFAAVIGWFALGEKLGGAAFLGMAITLGGVAWVVLERPSGQRPGERGTGPRFHPTPTASAERLSGLLLATIAAACQAGGLLLSKAGIGHGWLPREAHIAPQTATFLRMFFAAVTVLPTLVWITWRRNARPDVPRPPMDAGTRRAGYFFTVCGSVVGPFLGVWMSLVASDLAPLAVAQTLCSLPPVFILPILIVTRKEQISARAILGALVAVSGTAVLFARGASG